MQIWLFSQHWDSWSRKVPKWQKKTALTPLGDVEVHLNNNQNLHKNLKISVHSFHHNYKLRQFSLGFRVAHIWYSKNMPLVGLKHRGFSKLHFNRSHFKHFQEKTKCSSKRRRFRKRLNLSLRIRSLHLLQFFQHFVKFTRNCIFISIQYGIVAKKNWTSKVLKVHEKK